MKPTHVIGFFIGLMLSVHCIAAGSPIFFTQTNLDRLHESLVTD